MKDIIDFLVPSLKYFYSSLDVSIYQFTHEVFPEFEIKFLVNRAQKSCLAYFYLLRKINNIRRRLCRGTDFTNALKFLETLNLENINKNKQKVLVVMTDSLLGTDAESINVAETIKNTFDIVIALNIDGGQNNINTNDFNSLTKNVIKFEDINNFKIDLKNILLPVCQKKQTVTK